jgi:futalosine hydrolase
MSLLLACATALELKACLGPQLAGDPPAGALLPVRQELFALVTGIGPVNAAFRLGRALAAGAFSGVVNLGLAGSFQPARLPLGAAALVDAEIWPEFGLATDQGIDPRGLGFPLGEDAVGPVFDSLGLDPEAAAAAMGLALPQGLARAASLTVSAASGTPERAAKLSAAHPDALLENMEGFALAWGCRLAGLPFLEVRAVSNRVGARPPDGWDVNGGLKALGRLAGRLFR